MAVSCHPTSIADTSTLGLVSIFSIFSGLRSITTLHDAQTATLENDGEMEG
jgi:hypothetical protein